MRRISILGSSGSIGTQTLDVIRDNPGDFKVVCLAVNSNIDILKKQVEEFKPDFVCIYNEKKALEAKNILGTDVHILTGMDGLIECATNEQVDIVVGAVVGMIGVRPVVEAVKAGKDIALANKESLVTAGHIIMPLAEKMGVSILPVDSEHSAIFQCLQGKADNKIHKILLTASGGPFRGKKREELSKVQVEDALKHPNWSMGRKITIDSATLVNKGLEVMEAKWLFGVELEQIQVVVHPQSVVHSMVEYADGAVIAQLGTPDMRLPIQYALYYPSRRNLSGEKLDFYQLSNLTFEAPDTETFTGLKLAIQAMKQGGNVPTIFNAANEKAVALFLNRKISFLEIPEIIGESMENIQYIQQPDVDKILETEAETYAFIESRW